MNRIGSNPGELNRKLSRDVLAGSLSRIGALILEEVQDLAANNVEIRQFLDKNELTPMMSTLLPDQFACSVCCVCDQKSAVGSLQQTAGGLGRIDAAPSSSWPAIHPLAVLMQRKAWMPG